MLQRATSAKQANENANIEEQIKLAIVESQASKYLNTNKSELENIEESLSKTFNDTVTVLKMGKGYKIKIGNNNKTTYKMKDDGTVDKYEEMDPTEVYARLDDDGTLYLRATQLDDRYRKYISSGSIQSNWNTEGNATKKSINKVKIEEPISPTTTGAFFELYSNLETIENIENLHTENSNSMSYMFYSCQKLKELNVSFFDTNLVQSMGNMFCNCKLIKDIDISSFDTKNVKSLGSMFQNCSSLAEIDVSGFDTNLVQNMACMFSGCSSVTNLDLNNFVTDNVTSMSDMFYGCNKLIKLDLYNFDTKKVLNMNWLFSGCINLKKVILGKKFVINNDTNYSREMFCNNPKDIKIKSTQDTKDKILDKYPNLENNFEKTY